jgi:hypothetical protein
MKLSGFKILSAFLRSFTISFYRRLFSASLFNRLFFHYNFIILRSLTASVFLDIAGGTEDISLLNIIDLLKSLKVNTRYLSYFLLLLLAQRLIARMRR